ncbi:tetratricopeptide repeat protein [Achromobacter sp. Bel]|uniref:tetratricopeptide repeat protein n=1 Tax=Achromobacter sp. Bel TaxID=2727415 RepID=UPI00145ED07A|nr:tetratricopeptide repeat protein [Achromobacter sp. Bel]
MGKHNDPAVPPLTLSTALNTAHAHWNAGQAPQAEHLCLRVLQAAPDQPDARHLLGVIAHAYGLADLAITHLRVACRPASTPAIYCSNLAEMCRQRGLLDEAESAARRAVAVDPDLAEGWNNLGIILQERGQLAASLECLQRVAALLPASAEAHNNLGNTCKLLGNNAQAVQHYQHALALNPRFVLALCNLSAVLRDEGRHEAALAAIRRAIDIDPLTPQAHQILASLDATRAASPRPAAMAPFQAVHAQAQALLLAGRHADVDALLQKTLADGDGPIALWRQWGSALRALGRDGEARVILERVVAATPGDAGARFDLAEVLLLQGEFEAGWREYRFRYQMPHTVLRGRPIQQPRWEGQAIPGQTLLIHDEQGFGDTFQFLRLVALARARSSARVILEVNAACHALAARSGGFDQIIPAGTVPPAFDYHCELMSLPLALGLRLDDLPVNTAYLRPDPQRVAHWRARLAALPRPWVGLVWAGRPSHSNDAQRSMALADLAPLARAGVSFIGLQMGSAAAEAATSPAGMSLLPLHEEIRDFDDTAAIITLLDVLVTVDSSPAHLAGALGCPVWLLLPFVPDWRWLRGRADSPWYPTMRLFRQPAPHAWGPVLSQVAASLDELRTAYRR